MAVQREEIHDLIARQKRLKSERGLWESTWQELAEVLLPRRADFTMPMRPDGERRTDETYDSIPMQARRGLATALDGLIKPKTSRWFSIKATIESLNDDDEAKRWLEMAENRMFDAIYSRGARFIQRSGEVDNDVVTFGTGVLFIGEASGLNRLIFRSIHLRDVVIAENSDGVVDTIFVTMRLTARQAAQRYGEENLGRRVKEALGRGKKPDQEFEHLWVVMPREDRDSSNRNSRNLPFASLVIGVEDEHLVRESGFHEFPFAVPRWDTTSGEIYGRSPGMVALPDAETLQAMGKTLLVGGQRRVDPPLWMTSDGVISPPRTFPGGITVVDANAFNSAGGRPPFGELVSGANIPIGRDMQLDTREQVWGAFFRNVLNLPVDAGRMTATEVLERKEEFLRAIGPVFGQLESDYIGHIVERVFGIMLRAEAFPPPPEVLQGRDVQFEFESPVQRARKQMEAADFARSMELLAPLAVAQPELLDNFDGDTIARDMNDMGRFPQKWLRSEDQVRALRQQRAQRAQVAQIAELGGQAAEAASKVVPLFQEGQAA